MSAQIVGLRGPLSGRSFPLGAAPLGFGRAPENSVVIASPAASRRHAEIRFEAGTYLVYDLGSSNGTRVNGQPVRLHRLSPGDVLEIGEEAFRFEDNAAAYAPTVQAGSAAAGPPPGMGGQAPLPPLPAGVASSPAYRPSSPAAPRRANRLPLILAVVAVLGCTLLAALAGGTYLVLNRGINVNPEPTTTASEPSGPVPTRVPAPAGAARWTVLVYLDGDNNLEADALTDFREMAAVGSSDDLKILVQLDRISSSEGWDDTSAGDWAGTYRFLVERGMEPTPAAALEDLGELNMGSQETLADFVTWGVQNYPAEHYALIIWDHGASWLGVSSDDTDGATISLPALSTALDAARSRSGYGTLDLIGFDACLMAQLDVFKAVEPYGQVVVASAELEPNQGWAWDAWLRVLADDPTQDAYALAPVIVDTYIASYDDSMSDDVTLSAFDLAAVGTLTERLDELARAMIDEIGPNYSAIAQARSFVDVYAPTYAEEFNAVDLGHFSQLLGDQGATGSVANAATALNTALNTARLANGAGSYHRNTSGISIYFPQTAELLMPEYNQGSPLPRLTRWADFLERFHTQGDTSVTMPTISELSLSNSTVSVNNPTTLSGVISGDDLAYVFSFIGIPNASRDTVDLISVEFIYPPGVTPGNEENVPNWEAGTYDVSLTWDATNWYLSNGSEQIEVLLGPIRYGSTLYGVEGVYTSQATGEQIDAGLIFNVENGEATLDRIWGFPRAAGKQEPQPYELIPVPGDTFTAYLRTYTDTGNSLTPGSVEGQTITFGAQPLTADYAPTLNGAYVLGFLVRDIAGNFSYQYVDLTVDN